MKVLLILALAVVSKAQDPQLAKAVFTRNSLGLQMTQTVHPKDEPSHFRPNKGPVYNQYVLDNNNNRIELVEVTKEPESNSPYYHLVLYTCFYIAAIAAVGMILFYLKPK